MWGMLICAGLLVVIVVLSNRAPNLGLVNLVAFPVAIAVLLLLPLFGESMGEQLSVLIYTAYIFTSTLTMFCYVTACHNVGADACRMGALVQLLARLMLTVGLMLGYAFGSLSGSEPVIQSGIVVATCVYLLLAVVVYGSFRAMRQKQVEVVVQQVTESFEEASHAKIEEMACRYSLSGRERDVYLSLLRGGSAKSIAEELGLSPYTVQGYIQGLYTKLGVNKKDQAVRLFYEEDKTDS